MYSLGINRITYEENNLESNTILLMIAKNNKTHEFLVSEMKEKKFCKKYIAVVKGVVEKDEFER